MSNPTPTPTPALGALPEEIRAAIGEYADAEFACGEWTDEHDEPYEVLQDHCVEAGHRLVATLTAALSQGEADAARLAAVPDRNAPCGGVHPVLYHAVMDAIEQTVRACDTHELARTPREARAIDYAGILASSVEHAQRLALSTTRAGEASHG